MAEHTNPWLQFLDEQPRTAFLGAANEFLNSARGGTNANRRALDAVFNRTLDDFNQGIGASALANEDPSGLFANFVQGLDFTKRFAQINDPIPTQQRFNPRTRRLFFT